MAGEIIQYQTEDGVTVTRALEESSATERHFIEAISKAKALEKAAKKPRKKGKNDAS